MRLLRRRSIPRSGGRQQLRSRSRRPRRRTALFAAAVILGLVSAAILRSGAAADLCHTAAADPAGPPASAPFPSRLPLGAAVRWDRLQDSPGYRAFYLAHYSWLTPENELKMNSLEPESGQFTFGTADAIVNWGIAHGRQIHGHVLVWGNDLPDWATALRERTPTRTGRLRAAGALGAYIAAVLSHFRGRIHEWDVVNEAIDPAGGLTDNVWYHELGPTYIAEAFAAARRADPSLRLCYNDLGTELPGPHSTSLLAIVRVLRARGLIDCIGFETHTAVPGPDEAAMAGVLHRFAATGAQLLISELDVIPEPGRSTGTSAERTFLGAQAAVYGHVAAACRAEPGCRRLTTWGFTDASSWLGTPRQPLPFDSECRAKPAWGALQSILRPG